MDNRRTKLYYFYDFFIDSVICIFSFYFMLLKKTAELQLLKKNMVLIVFVTKIVKMKYNRIDIKWQHVSTSFKI